MDLKKVFAISGYPDLYKFVTQTRNGILVESLSSKKRMVAFNYYKISSLEDIQVYTETGEIPLKEVFKRIYKKQNGQKVEISMADRPAIEKFIEEVLPEYDRQRVKFSDMKKIIKWYNILLQTGYIKEEEQKENQDQKEDQQEQQQKEQ